MMKTRYDLTKDGSDEATGEWSALPGFDEVVEIALHALEDEIKLLGVWHEKEIIQWYDAGVKRNCTERLYARELRGTRVRTRARTDLELLELLAFIPTSFPLLLHPLDGDETPASPLWTGTTTALHRREGGVGGQRTMPITEEDSAEGAITQRLDRRI